MWGDSMVDISLHNPTELATPYGPYTQMTRVKNHRELVFIAGQLSVDPEGNIVGEDDFDRQCEQVYSNVGAALRDIGADYLVSSEHIPSIYEWRKREFPKLFPTDSYPPNTLLVIERLVNEAFLIEVQTVAAL
jgi:enamine deaminase RidA (YjgF/YER057c/UK114 family)